MTDFNERFLTYLRKHCKNSCVMLTETKGYKGRRFYHMTEITPGDIEDAVKEWRSVGLCTADATIISNNFVAYAQSMKDNYVPEFQDMELPGPGHPLDPKKLLPMSRQYGMAGAVSSDDIFYKPVIMVDFDIKDARKQMLDKGLIDKFEHDELEDGTGPRSKYLIHDMPRDRVMSLVNDLFDINSLIRKTQPMLILFTGGGLHVWYGLTVKTDKYRYKTLHTHVREKIKAIWPDLDADEAAQNINQNLRLPGSYNLKPLSGPSPTQLLYLADDFTMPEWVGEYHSKLRAGHRDAATTRKTYGSDGYSENSLVRGAILTAQKGSMYRAGLRNLKRDPRLWKMIKANLTFQAICDYALTPIQNLTIHNETAGNNLYQDEIGEYAPDKDKDPYMICSSPLRKDNNPSFMVFPKAMVCRDLGRHNTELDFGELMYELLKQAKARLGLDPYTTRYEASYHCIFCCYLAYRQRTGKDVLPMLDKDLHKEYVEWAESQGIKLSPAEKKHPPAKSYYANMQGAFTDQWNFLVKNPSCSHEDFLKFLLSTTPSVYYFYDPEQAAANARYLANTLALCLIHFINKLRIGIQKTPNGKYKVYVVNKLGMHQPWETWIPIHSIAGEDDKTSEIVIHNFLVSSNITEGGKAPGGTPVLSSYIYRNLSMLDEFPTTLDRYMEGYDITEHTVKMGMCNLINDTYPLVRVSPSDLDITLLSNEHYLEFDNKFVLYLAEDATKIGTVINKTGATRRDLIRTSVVDFRIRHMYDERGGPTPMWTRFLDSLTYLDNCFNKCIRYFMGSMLYYPEGQTKALLVLGRSGNNGKSVLADVVTGLLGREHVTKKDIADITSTSDRGKNARVGLMNSVVNITQDAPKSKIADSFKGMVEGESVQVRELYNQEKEVELRTHYLVNANTPPATWGEAKPMVKRILFCRVDREIPPDKMILNLSSKILNSEAHLIWPAILQDAKLFREKGMSGFLTREEILRLQTEVLKDNDLWNFINDYVLYDPADKHNVPVGKQTFKRLYNDFRRYINKNTVKTDNVTDEAEVFIQDKFRGIIPTDVLEKGFGENRIKGLRGLPIRIYVPEGAVGNTRAIDSNTCKGIS